MLFVNKEHEDFFQKTITRLERHKDSYLMALVYTLGISENCRNHWADCYNEAKRCVIPKCLKKDWVTSTDRQVIRLAFNLYTDGIPTAYGMQGEDLERELSLYSVSDIFNTNFAPYFWQAIQIRYPTCTTK